MPNSPEKHAINSKIDDLIKNKYPSQGRGLAFVDLATDIVCDQDIQDEDITDGSDDHGVDSVIIVHNEQGLFINIFNCKSSESGDFSEKELREFKSGLDYLFVQSEEDWSKLQNKNLIAKIDEIRNNKELIQEVNCFYCFFNGSDNPNEKVIREKRKIEDFFLHYFESIYPNAKFSLGLMRAEDLYSLDLRRKQSLRGKTVVLPYFGDKTISTEIETDKVKGRLATASGKDIANLVKKYEDALFEKNVRGWMSFRKYNKDILSACSSREDAQLFWFLNNGITIVCEKCTPDPDKKILKINNLQIINGQQTSIVLQKALENQSLQKSVKVLLKIYETDDIDIITKVAKATNSQLVVKSRDLVSNNPEQIALQNGFLRKSYFYERQRGEQKPRNKTLKAKFNNFFVAQSVLSINGHPSLAKKKQEDKIFGEPNYSEIFKGDFNKILAATLLCDFCLKKGRAENRKNIKDEIKYFAYFHIAMIIWADIKEEIKPSELIKLIESNKTKKLEKNYDSAVNILVKIFSEHHKKEKIFSIGHFFSRLEIENDIRKNFKK